MANLKFEELNLSNDLLKAVISMGFEATTPIQSEAIPAILNGEDVVGLASTGTGKTAAFGLPAIEKIDPKSRKVQVLVLCPTRELAMQVSAEMNKFLKFKRNISSLPVYGGQDIRRQIFALRRGPQIIIGTPGRVMDHMERGTINFKDVNMVVLDEADEMLNMGFRQDIERILKSVKKERQTVLFSATMSPAILQITKHFQKNSKLIKVAAKKVDTSAIDQSYVDVEGPYKIDMLMDLLNKYNPKLAIIFCNTRRKVDKIADILHKTGYNVAGIHGDIRQSRRDAIMNKFRRGRINILVATDVAARGIDVSDIEIIFNFEIPREIESYVHRIGRTGRAGKTGKAISLISRLEFRQFRNIMRYTKIDVRREESQLSGELRKRIVADPKPINDEFAERRLEKKAERVLRKVKSNIGHADYSTYLTIASDFTSNNVSSEDLSAALLKMLVDSDSRSRSSRRFNR